MERIGFIGLGNMGRHMSANQLKGQRRVWAYDLSPAAVARAQADGCEAAASVADCVREAEVVITSLPAGPHVRQVVTEEVLAAARPGGW